MKLQLEIKYIFGTRRCYPACEDSRLIAEWLQKKSFTERDIDFMKALGVEIENVTKKEEL